MEFLKDFFTALLLLLGGAFMLLAALGIVKMPDVYTRMQPATKGATLGAGFLFGAVALHFSDTATTTKALAGIAFLLCTAPIAAHMMGRSAIRIGIPLWEKSVADERNAIDLE